MGGTSKRTELGRARGSRPPRIHDAASRPSLRDERGSALVEFALVASVLVMLLFGILELGIAYNKYLTLTDAARAAARYASVQTGGNPCAQVGSYLRANYASLAGVSVSPSSCSGKATGDRWSVTVSVPQSLAIPLVTTRLLTLSTTVVEREEAG